MRPLAIIGLGRYTAFAAQNIPVLAAAWNHDDITTIEDGD
jgi:hypothetical protein